MAQPTDALQLPSYTHLNRAQKRIFIIRDLLKFLDPLHLDTLLEGVADPEPPNYRIINGKVSPPLTEITLKEAATQIDLGNVRFREGTRSVIRRVHLFVEDGNCEMRESEALPEKDDDLDSVPIDVYLIKSTVALFQTKHEAIVSRARQLNEVRKCSFASVQKTNTRVGEGKVCIWL
jgi:hypothetical protein